MNLNPIDTELGAVMNVKMSDIQKTIINEECIEWSAEGGEKIYGLLPGSELNQVLLPAIVNGNVWMDIRTVLNDGNKIINRASWDRMQVEMALIDDSLIDDHIDAYKRYYIESLQAILGGELTVMMYLDNTDKQWLMNILALYAVSLFSEYSVDESLAVYETYSVTPIVDREMLRTAVEKIGEVRILDDIGAVISELDVVSDRLKKIDTSALKLAASKLGYGDNANSLVAGLEVPSMWIANSYVIYNNTLYKNSRLMKYMLNTKKVINHDKMSKMVDRIMKKYKFDI